MRTPTRSRRGHARLARGSALDGFLEVLRLLVVLIGAGAGYEWARLAGPHSSLHTVGAFGGAGIGVILGSAVGYVLGGMFGRGAVAGAARAEVALREVSADTLVAGGFGAVAGILVGIAVGWPLFLVPQRLVAGASFGLVVLLAAFFGFRLGSAKRDDMLAMFSGSSGVGPRGRGAASLVKVLDTSVAIDGRIVDVVRAGFLTGEMLVVVPVLEELQRLADSAEPTRRARGRRGLEVLDVLRRERGVDLTVVDDEHPDVAEVDAKLVRSSLDDGRALVTLDSNLAKVADLTGVRVLNLHRLSLALRPPVVVGEDVTVQLIKAGREPGQAVGYLDDGTMVVVEKAKALVGRDVSVRVASVVMTANGRLVFASPSGPGPAQGRARTGAAADTHA